MGQGNGAASREFTSHGLASDNLRTGEHLPSHWRAPGSSIEISIYNIMVAIREKRVAYKHPDLCALQSKQERKFFLHPKVELAWIEKAAELGIQALIVGLLLQFRVVLNGNESVTLPKDFLAKFWISRGVKRRALKRLEEASLICVVQEQGCSPVITVLKV